VLPGSLTAYTGDPGNAPLGTIKLPLGAITSSWHNTREVYDGGALASWLNEWGALRGSAHSNSKFDALVRAIGRTDYASATHQGAGYAAMEIINSARTSQYWGRHWLDGTLIRNAVKHVDTLLWLTGSPDPTADTSGQYGYGAASTGYTPSISPSTFAILVHTSSAEAAQSWAPAGRSLRLNLS
jgi:hypothetical protein